MFYKSLSISYSYLHLIVSTMNKYSQSSSTSTPSESDSELLESEKVKKTLDSLKEGGIHPNMEDELKFKIERWKSIEGRPATEVLSIEDCQSPTGQALEHMTHFKWMTTKEEAFQRASRFKSSLKLVRYLQEDSDSGDFFLVLV